MAVKEKDIIELQVNMDYVKKTLADLGPKINEMHDTFLKGEGKISNLNKVVFGNGKKGLTELQAENRKDINDAKAVIGFWKWAIGIIGFANLALILKIFI